MSDVSIAKFGANPINSNEMAASYAKNKMATAAILDFRLALPVFNFSIWTLFYALVFQISLKSVNIWLSYCDKCIFKMAAAAILNFGFYSRFLIFECILLLYIHPENLMMIGQSVQKLLHFLFPVAYNGIPIQRPKFGDFGGHAPKCCNFSTNTPKGTSLGQNTSFEPSTITIGPPARAVARDMF